MKKFNKTGIYVTLVLKNIDTGDYLMDYDEDYGELRAVDFELKNKGNLLSGIVDVVEEKGVNLVSYTELGRAHQVQYVYKNDTPGTEDEEIVVLALVENMQNNKLIECPQEKCAEAVKSSSVLDELTKTIILDSLKD